MRILITGASGFLGSHLAGHLSACGHDLILAARHPETLRRVLPRTEIMACDFSEDTIDTWLPKLIGIDAVINAVGIFREVRPGDFETIHSAGPSRLFEACAEAGIGRVIQISAEGADKTAFSAFHLSKKVADDYLEKIANERGETGWIVLRPSVVVGRGGGSTALFSTLAALPFPMRIGTGQYSLRPLHIDDFVQAVAGVLKSNIALPRRLDLVGAEKITTDQFTAILRGWLGLRPVHFIGLPEFIWTAAAGIGDHMPNSLLSSESLKMLQRGHASDHAPAFNALGWKARPLDKALALTPASPADRFYARLSVIKPALRFGLSAIWLAGGIVSAFVYPVNRGATLVEGLGSVFRQNRDLAHAVVYCGTGLDMAIGLALLFGLARRWLSAVQLTTISLYTLLGTIAAPQLWVDPFGALVKNIAVVLAVCTWAILEDVR